MSKFTPSEEDKVDGISPSIRGKMTEFFDAAMQYAFLGSMMVGDRDAVKNDMHAAWYNLERTIKTELDKKTK